MGAKMSKKIEPEKKFSGEICDICIKNIESIDGYFCNDCCSNYHTKCLTEHNKTICPVCSHRTLIYFIFQEEK